MNRIADILDWVAEAVGKIVSLVLLAMMVSVALEIVLRLFTGRPLIWTYEMSLFLFGGYVMLLGGYALKCESHVRLDFFYGRASERTKAILDLITFPFFLIFVCVLLYLSVEAAYETWIASEQSQSLWAPYLFPIKVTIPIGALLMLLPGVAKFMRNISRVSRHGRSD